MPLNDLAAKMIARVTLEIALRKEFDYLIPPELVGQVDVGSRVQVPFGPRKVSGCVTAIAEESAHARLKPILKVIGAQTLVTPKILKLARWMGEYYCCPPEIALKSVLPEAVRKEQSGWRERLYVRALTPTGELPKLAKRQREVWNIIEERREMPLQELVELAETTSATVRHLEDKGLVAIAAEISERDPYAREQILPTTALDLNLQQVRALVKIKEAIDGAQVLPTGSTRVSRVDLGVPPKSGSPQSSVFPKEVIRRDAELNPRDAGATLEDSSHSSDPTRGVVSEPTVRRRRLPHFEIPGSIYHLTWRTHGKLVLSPEAREKVLAACHHWHGEKIKCYLACVMPDHVHLLIQPLPVQKAGVAAVHPLSEILHSIKSFSAHEANKVMKRKGPVWTDESFDRMIRSESDLHEKWEYIWNNPRVLGLVGPLEEYPFIWTPGPPGERAAGTIRRDAESNPRDAGATPEIGGASVNPTGSAHILPFLKGTIRRDAESNPRDAGATPEIGGANVAPAGAGHSSVFLLHGVTGSGKTEVYLQALAHALEQGKGGIVLVPEISLTPQTVERFKARFSSGPLRTLVAVLHSHLSAGERHDEWHKIRQGRARVVIGARSAIFAPLDPLGLIIVDEEHEHTYKQEEAPRYHARDVAIVRGQMEGATVVLGSATPSMESFYNCGRGKYTLLEMPERV
ncbi:MAG TPA: primosomal protein N', partial [Verrucomicrobiae bacterium]|nr:primosomal protein N' [Verrucomicrobiae bacterium]